MLHAISGYGLRILIERQFTHLISEFTRIPRIMQPGSVNLSLSLYHPPYRSHWPALAGTHGQCLRHTAGKVVQKNRSVISLRVLPEVKMHFLVRARIRDHFLGQSVAMMEQ